VVKMEWRETERAMTTLRKLSLSNLSSEPETRNKRDPQDEQSSKASTNRDQAKGNLLVIPVRPSGSEHRVSLILPLHVCVTPFGRLNNHPGTFAQ
jgi:hypothetical protein